ncbi:MAG TPA: PAS domain S-box protein [Polyangia bacterium]|nr:PAS domain S-box protein [Polyangia bacterium]
MDVPHDIEVGRLLEGFSDAIVAADTAGRIVYANRATGRLFGWSPEELLGQPLTVLMPPRWRAAHQAGFHRYVTTHEARIIGRTIRVPGLRKDGAEIDVELSLSAFRQGDGREFMVAALRDLGPRMVLEQALTAERATNDRLTFLAEASALLDASLDYATTLQLVARLAVPKLADACFVDLLDEDGQLRRVATAHRDPDKESLLRTTEDRYVARGGHPAATVLRTGAPVLHEDLTAEMWTPMARDEGHLHVIGTLRPRAWIFQPLTARSRVLGTIAFVLSEPGRRFSAEDQVLAQELARRAALAIDNARLYTAERRERERLYSLFMQAPAAIAILRGPDFRYELSNPLHQELTQGRALVGKTVDEALPELEAIGLREVLERVYRTGQPVVGKEVPLRVATPTGERALFLNGVYHPLRAADGSIEGVMILAYEVTEQVLARQQVEVTERLFRTLTNHAPVGIFLTNATGDCEFVNPRWCELAGLSPEEAAGQGWVRSLHPEDAGRVFREWYEAAQTGRPFESRYRFQTPQGRVSWILGSSVELRDASGALTGYLGTVTDVTEQQKAEAERERLLADLQQALRERDDFLSVASHELRTPLTTLRIHVEMLERMAGRGEPERASERVRGKLEKIVRQVTRLEDLIRTLLDVSRITQGRLELQREEMDLAELVREVVSRFSEELAEAGCAVQLTAGSPVRGRWDRGRLDQVVTNLVTNAMKYGKGRPVDIEVGDAGDRPYVRVVDHGIGIPPQDRARIFEKFERAVSGLQYGGLGLGLWIARQLVEAHGGALQVDDTPGGGATFTLELNR